MTRFPATKLRSEIPWNRTCGARYPWDSLRVGDYFVPNPVCKGTMKLLVHYANRTRTGKKFGRKTTKNRWYIYRRV